MQPLSIPSVGPASSLSTDPEGFTPLAERVTEPAGLGFWVNREGEAKRVLNFILGAERQLVVLYGRNGIGKTTLIRRWLMPMLAPGREAAYFDCLDLLHQAELAADKEREVPALPSVPGALLFFDTVECLLETAGPEGEMLLGRILTLRRENPTAILVLIVSDTHLRKLFKLETRDPGILDRTLEITGVELGAGLAQLAALTSPRTVAGEPAMSGGTVEVSGAAVTAGAPAVESRLLGIGENVSPELLSVVENQLRRTPPAIPLVAGEKTTPLDLDTLLWNYLKERLDAVAADGLGDKARFEVGFGLLEEVTATAAAPPQASRWQDLARRMGVTESACDAVYRSLQGEHGLVRQAEGGRVTLAPVELARVVIAESARRQADARDARRVLDHGIAIWRAKGLLLAQREFREVHTHRRALRLNPEQVELLIRSALILDRSDDLQKALYWLERCESSTRAADILVSLLFHRQPAVRARTASLLADYPQSAVSGQLLTVALRDDDPDVRARANTALLGMRSPDLRLLLVNEIRRAERPPYKASRYQETALETLCIFKDAETVAILRELIAAPSTAPAVRRSAIAGLATLQVPEAVDLLVEVGLLSASPEDRAVAASGLGSTRSPELVRRIATSLRTARSIPGGPPGGSRWDRAARMAVQGMGAILLAAANNLPLPGVALIAQRRYGKGLALLATAYVALAIGGLLEFEATAFFTCLGVSLACLALGQVGGLRVALDRRRQLASTPWEGLLAGALCAFSLINPAFWLVPGLAHLAARRLRAAGYLFLLRLASIPLLVLVTTMDMPWRHGALTSRLLAASSHAYYWLAWGLVVATVVGDVMGVLVRDVILSHRLELRQRRLGICRHLLREPGTAFYFFELTASPAREEACWARQVLRGLGHEIDPLALVQRLDSVRPEARSLWIRALARGKNEAATLELLASWPRCQVEGRQWIFDVLAKNPTEASIHALSELRRKLSWRQQVRYAGSILDFRIGVWPPQLLLSAVVAAPLIVILTDEGLETHKRAVRPLLRALGRPGLSLAQRAQIGDILAQGYSRDPEHQLVGSDSVHQLASLFEDEELELPLRLRLVGSLATIAGCSSDSGQHSDAEKDALHALVAAIRPGSARQRDAHWPTELRDQLRSQALVSLRSVAGKNASLLADQGTLPILAAIAADTHEQPLPRRLAIDVLGAAGTPAAVEELVALANGRSLLAAGTTYPGATVPELTAGEETIRLDAVKALRAAGTLPAWTGLRVLERAAGSSALRDAARAAAAEPLWAIQHDLDTGDPEAALRAAATFLAPGQDAPSVPPRSELCDLAARALRALRRPEPTTSELAGLGCPATGPVNL
jgi:hypothetical protein